MNSVICHPLDGEKILTNSILIERYAIATGDCTIKCVELSTDGGETWIQAELQESQHPWAWQFWRSQIYSVFQVNEVHG